MKIVVCIKQVPDTVDIKWTENNTINRDGVESVINPFDEYAIETALKIKDKYKDVSVIAISMGPKQAENILKKAIALGCNEAILLCDKKFAGADTLATSKTLATAISKKIPDFDLIICGQFAIDGDTAQTGVGIAEKLNIPQITYVSEITDFDEKFITVKKEIETGTLMLKTQLPALICTLKGDYEPRKALIDGYIKAQDYNIPVFTAEDIELNADEAGLKGSPTYVSKAFRPQQKNDGEFIKFDTTEQYINFLNEEIKKSGVNCG